MRQAIIKSNQHSIQKVMVTGASGFVGRIVSAEVLRRGYGLHAVSRSESGNPNIGEWHGHDWAAGPIALSKLIQSISPDVIFHGAGSASVLNSVVAPAMDFQSAVGTWATLLEAVRLSGQKPLLILPSSAAVYGDPGFLPVPEEAKLSPLSPYGWHKVTTENLASAYAQTFDVSILIVRIFSLIGPSQRRLLAWELFDRLRRDDGPLKILGTGKESRDFLYEEDASAAIIDLALEASRPKGIPLTVNLASGIETSTKELAHSLVDFASPGREVVCCGMPRPGDPHRWCADVSRLKTFIPEWNPRTLAQTLQDTVEGWRNLSLI